jgi:hypothetical protein
MSMSSVSSNAFPQPRLPSNPYLFNTSDEWPTQSGHTSAEIRWIRENGDGQPAIFLKFKEMKFKKPNPASGFPVNAENDQNSRLRFLMTVSKIRMYPVI